MKKKIYLRYTRTITRDKQLSTIRTIHGLFVDTVDTIEKEL